jgi:hypothetical protein
MYGFRVYTFGNCPVFTTGGQKKAVGSAESGNEYQASFAFHTKRVFKATGTTDMYYLEARNNPQYQRSLVNFRHMYICLPKKADAIGAIMSDVVAAA